MLSEPLDLSQIDASEIIDTLYAIFHRDFIESRTYLAGQIYINPRSSRKDDGKELDFWHLTTREEKEKTWEGGKLCWKSLGRFTDFQRACRLEWIKQIISNHDHPCIKLFYHQETNKKRNIRLYLWAHKQDFVVILQKLGKADTFLVTSFYVDNQGKRDTFNRRFKAYVAGEVVALDGCEWF